MSGVRRCNRKSTDFTIARILGDSSQDYSNIQDINLTKAYSSIDKLIYNKNFYNSNSNRHCLLTNNIQNNKNSFQTTQKIVQHEIINSTSTRKIIDGDDIKKRKNIVTLSSAQSINDLHWVQCTRYRPPKLPRKLYTTKVSRRSAVHPRIPFTSHQLQVLEDKYKTGAYLSRKDVIQLSTILRIPNNRIKIWFQNRRARDRRETKLICNPSSMDDNNMV